MVETMEFYINDQTTNSPDVDPTIKVTLTINEDGSATFNVLVVTSPDTVDIVGALKSLYFDVSNEAALLNNLQIKDAPSSLVLLSGNDSISGTGGGDNLNGLPYDGFDFAVKMDDQGSGDGSDLTNVTFTLKTIDGSALTLQDFSQVPFAVRLQTVGPEDGAQEGSAKMGETTFNIVTPPGVITIEECVDENTMSDPINLLHNPQAGYEYTFQIAGKDLAGNDFTLHAGEEKAVVIDSGRDGILGTADDISVTLSLSNDGHLTIDATHIEDNIDGLSEGDHIDQKLTYSVIQTNPNEPGDTVTQTSTIDYKVCGVNDAPDAVDDHYAEGVTVGTTMGFASVLGNDSDPDNKDIIGDNVLVTAVNGIADGDALDTDGLNGNIKVELAGLGVITMHPDGTFTFEAYPDVPLGEGQSKPVEFQYTITDQHGENSLSDTANVTFLINGVNDAPDAVNDHYAPGPTEGTTMGFASVLGNDSDPDNNDFIGQNVLVTAVNGVADGNDMDGLNGTIKVEMAGLGVVTMHPDGTFTFDAYADIPMGEGESKPVSFEYTITDQHGENSLSDTATVTFDILGKNDAPDAVDDHYAPGVPVGESVGFASVLGNDSDPDHNDIIGQNVLVTAVNGIADGNDMDGLNGSIKVELVGLGVVIMHPDGTFTFDAYDDIPLGEGESKPVSFEYTITDQHGANSLSDTATVTFEINGKNDAPNAVDDHYTQCVEEGTTVAFASVLGNDSDPDHNDIMGQNVLITAVNGVTDGNDMDGLNGSIKVELAGVGIVTMKGDGTFTFQAYDDPNLFSPNHKDVSFDYTISDQHGANSLSDSANVKLMVCGAANEPPPVDVPLPTLHQGLSNVVFYIDQDASNNTVSDVVKIKMQMDDINGKMLGDLDNFTMNNHTMEQYVISQLMEDGYNSAQILGYTVHAGQEFSNTWDTAVLPQLMAGYNKPLAFQEGEGVFFHVGSNGINTYDNADFKSDVNKKGVYTYDQAELGDGMLIKNLAQQGAGSLLAQEGITAKVLSSGQYAATYNIALSPTDANHFIVL